VKPGSESKTTSSSHLGIILRAFRALPSSEEPSLEPKNKGLDEPGFEPGTWFHVNSCYCAAAMGGSLPSPMRAVLIVMSWMRREPSTTDVSALRDFMTFLDVG